MLKTGWNIEKIKNGFERFLKENERMPTSREIDKIDYLPAVRTIQRQYGGLEKLRTNLGFSITHFGKGASRSIIAKEINKRGGSAEAEIKDLLEHKFGEMFVHLERPFALSSKQRLDFYVFSPSGNFGVDVFYPKDLFSMAASISLKQVSYKNYNKKLYFVVANPNISGNDINKWSMNKKNILKGNFIVITIEDFKNVIKDKKTYLAIIAGDK